MTQWITLKRNAVESIILKKGYDFYTHSVIECDMYSYSWDKSNATGQASKFLTLETCGGSDLTAIHYQTLNKNDYLSIKQGLTAKGFKLTETEGDSGSMFNYYDNGKYIMMLSAGKDKSSYVTTYEISISKK